MDTCLRTAETKNKDTKLMILNAYHHKRKVITTYHMLIVMPRQEVLSLNLNLKKKCS
jgi:hypothetical protein